MGTKERNDFEYDQRQYKRMLDRLEDFEQQKISFERLVDDLEGLLNALEMPDARWKEQFQTYWIRMETARAVALDEGLKEFSPSTLNRIREAAAHLKLLVLEKIDDPADRIRPSGSRK